MSTSTPSWRTARAKLARQARFNPEADPTELRREIRAGRLAEHVAQIVAEAPPLTREQLDRIATIIAAAPLADADEQVSAGEQ
jgi:hypothetical protein